METNPNQNSGPNCESLHELEWSGLESPKRYLMAAHMYAMLQCMLLEIFVKDVSAFSKFSQRILSWETNKEWNMQLLLKRRHHKPHNSHPTVQSLVPYLYLQNSNHLGRSNRRKGKMAGIQEIKCVSSIICSTISLPSRKFDALTAKRWIFSSWSTQMSKTYTGSHHGRWGITCISFDCLTTSRGVDTKTTGNLHYATVPHLSYSYCYMDPQYFIWAVGVPITSEKSNHWQSRIRNEYQKRYILHVLCASTKKNDHVGLGCQSFAKTCRIVFSWAVYWTRLKDLPHAN